VALLAAALGLAMGAQQCKQGLAVTITGGWCDKRVITGNFCVDSAAPTAMTTAFQNMVQSFSKVQLCSLDPQVNSGKSLQASKTKLGTTNPSNG
jgi:hypothetical protein